MLPRKLENFNVIVDGRPLAGVAEEITLPKLERKTESFVAGGMLGPVELDLGMDGLKLEFTLAEFNAEILKTWGVADAGGINLRFLGAARADNADGTVEAIEISVRGRWKTIDKGNAKRHELAKMKVEMPLTYFEYRSNGVTLAKIDLIAGIEITGGVDRSQAVREAIGLAS
jgi:uncharacterized protein